MATSSIFKNFTVEGPVEVENFVKMLDAEPMPRPRANVRRITSNKEAWDILERAVEGMKTKKAGSR